MSTIQPPTIVLLPANDSPRPPTILGCQREREREREKRQEVRFDANQVPEQSITEYNDKSFNTLFLCMYMLFMLSRLCTDRLRAGSKIHCLFFCFLFCCFFCIFCIFYIFCIFCIFVILPVVLFVPFEIGKRGPDGTNDFVGSVRGPARAPNQTRQHHQLTRQQSGVVGVGGDFWGFIGQQKHGTVGRRRGGGKGSGGERSGGRGSRGGGSGRGGRVAFFPCWLQDANHFSTVVMPQHGDMDKHLEQCI